MVLCMTSFCHSYAITACGFVNLAGLVCLYFSVFARSSEKVIVTTGVPEWAALQVRPATQGTVPRCSVCPLLPQCFIPLAESMTSDVEGHAMPFVSCVQSTSHFLGQQCCSEFV